jgi:hypothetical protein
MKTYTEEDLRKAYEAGQRQKEAEFYNDAVASFNSYDEDAEENFESWLIHNYPPNRCIKCGEISEHHICNQCHIEQLSHG